MKDKKSLIFKIVLFTIASLLVVTGIATFLIIRNTTPNYRVIKNDKDVTEIVLNKNKDETIKESDYMYKLEDNVFTFDNNKVSFKFSSFIDACPSYKDFRINFSVNLALEEGSKDSIASVLRNYKFNYSDFVDRKYADLSSSGLFEIEGYLFSKESHKDKEFSFEFEKNSENVVEELFFDQNSVKVLLMGVN